MRKVSAVGRASRVFKLLIATAMIALVTLMLRTGLRATLQQGMADRVLGQFDFQHKAANTVDADTMDNPYFVAIDKSVTPNRLYVADWQNSRVLGFHSLSALVSGANADIVIGQRDLYSAGCNPPSFQPTQYTLCNPIGLAVDSRGNLFVADAGNNRVLEYNQPFAAGVAANIPAVAVLGQGGNFFANACNIGANQPNAETLCGPAGLALDSINNLYVADQSNRRALEYNAPVVNAAPANRVFGQLGDFTTSATNKVGLSANSLNNPAGIAADPAGNVYIADSSNNRVLEYYTPLKATAVPGSGDTTADRVFGQSGLFNQASCNGPNSGSLCNPVGVGFDPFGNLFIGSFYENRVLEFTPPFSNNPVAIRVFGQFGAFTLTGCNTGVDASQGPAPSSSTLCGPAGLGLDGSGDMLIADRSNNRVLEFKPPFGADPVASLVLGQADYFDTVANSVDDSGLDFPGGITVDVRSAPNHLYVADTMNNRVLGYASAATFVNGGAPDIVIGQPDYYSGGCNQVGTISARTLCAPQGLAVDSGGNLFVSDRNNNRVLKYMRPFNSGYSANEPASAVFGQNGSFSTNPCNGGTAAGSASTLCNPGGLFVDSKGNLYVADSGANRVLKFLPPFAVSPVASVVLGQANFTAVSSNRGGVVSGNTLSNPTSVFADGAGDLYVSDSGNNRALEYSAPIGTGAAAHMVFGQNGSFSNSVCNAASPTSLCGPRGLWLDAHSNLYIADSLYNRVLEYANPLVNGSAADRVFGQIDNFYGNSCNLGANSPSAFTLCQPQMPALDSAGNLYVADSLNNRVLEYDPPTPAATPTRTPVPANTPTASRTPSPTGTRTPAPTASRTFSATASRTPSPTASHTPAPTPSRTPVPKPT